MKLTLSLCAGLFLATTSFCNAIEEPDKDLLVKTSSGKVSGFVNESAPDVRQFLGIPFAKAPVNELRFLPPQPIADPDSEPIKAHKYPPACPQFATAIPSVQNQDAPETLPDLSGGISEDCLSLSVWAPRSQENTTDETEKLPVIIWVYGGGFIIGSTYTHYQIPTNWVQRSKRHIVVGIQYRLNIFGYPNAAGLDSQNLGFLDQRLAIEWVRDNIAAFGGDPDRITLWGQSAGAKSIDVLNFAYPKDPIVRGQICDSGSTLLPFESADYSHSNFSSVAKQFGCQGNKTAELKCMQKVPADEITSFLQQYGNSGQTPKLNFYPIPDGKVFFKNYTEQYLKGAGADIPAIFGTTANEAVSLIAYPEDPAYGPDEGTIVNGTRSFFLCPAATSSKLRDGLGRTTYRFLYAGNFTNISPRYWQGAYHAAELPLIFGTSGEFRGESTEFEQATSEKMQDLWLAFAEDPEKAKGWESYHDGKALVFAEDEKTVQVESIAGIDSPCS